MGDYGREQGNSYAAMAAESIARAKAAAEHEAYLRNIGNVGINGYEAGDEGRNRRNRSNTNRLNRISELPNFIPGGVPVNNGDMQYIVLEGENQLEFRDSEEVTNEKKILDIEEQIKILKRKDPRCVRIGKILKPKYFQAMLIPKDMIKPIIRRNDYWREAQQIAEAIKYDKSSLKELDIVKKDGEFINKDGISIGADGYPINSHPRYYNLSSKPRLESYQKETSANIKRYNNFKYNDNTEDQQMKEIIIRGSGMLSGLFSSDSRILDLEAQITKIISNGPCTLVGGIFMEGNTPCQKIMMSEATADAYIGYIKYLNDFVAKAITNANATRRAKNAANRATKNATNAAKRAANAQRAANANATRKAKSGIFSWFRSKS